MAEGQKSNQILNPQARQAMDQFKQQVASELGITNYQGYLGDVPSRLNGAVGGNMVRRMIALAESSLAGGQIPQAIQGTTTPQTRTTR
jgi:hypothetical protein